MGCPFSVRSEERGTASSIPEVTQNKVGERGGEGGRWVTALSRTCFVFSQHLDLVVCFIKQKIYNNNEMVGQRKNNTNQLFVNFKIKFIMQLREIGFATLKSTTFI